MTAVFAGEHFMGFHPRNCGEHRTVGAHRAWCHDCQEWCYPKAPCIRCDTRQQREILAQELRERAPDLATTSRDFGRGFMHAVRLLEEG